MKISLSYILLIFLFSILFVGCESAKPMKVSTIKRLELKDVPSASGIEHGNGFYWIIGDNSPYLFQLDQNFNLLGKVTLEKLDHAVDGVIPKLKKVDLEAILSMKWKVDSVLFLFGSGSKLPDRAAGWKINMHNPAIQERIDLLSFYELLMEETKLKENELNIEAAVELDGKIYLLNRGKNKLISIKTEHFIEFIEGQRDDLKIKTYTIDLPKVDGIEAGFSGAAVDIHNKRIIFTASVENTSDWINDGQVLGSFIGIIEIDQLENHYHPSTVLIAENEETLILKVESIALKYQEGNTYDCILVTDSDGGKSELLELTIDF
jgi:hypothetical protein